MIGINTHTRQTAVEEETGRRDSYKRTKNGLKTKNYHFIAHLQILLLSLLMCVHFVCKHPFSLNSPASFFHFASTLHTIINVVSVHSSHSHTREIKMTTTSQFCPFVNHLSPFFLYLSTTTVIKVFTSIIFQVPKLYNLCVRLYNMYFL